jgi:hypothetical protein
MAEGTPVGRSEWLGRQALLLFRMGLVALLVDGLLAAGALLIILAIGTLAHQMRSQCVDFDALPALAADDEHGTGIEVVHVLVVLLHEALVHSLAEFANLILVHLVGVFTCAFLWNLDEFVTHVQLLLLLLTPTSLRFLRAFCLDRLLVKILRLLHSAGLV